MKRFLPVLFSMVLISGVSEAQTVKAIPNGDFENWDSTAFIDLNAPWITQNSFNISHYGTAAVTKVPGKVGSAVRLQTHVKGTDTIVGTLLNNGTPYTQMPTGISGYSKCNVLGQDTAFIVLEFIQAGIIIDFEAFPFTGTDTTSYTSFNFSFADSLPMAPDSVYIIIISSNEVDDVGITSGSWLELDQLAFTGIGITQQIPEGSFENWGTNSVDYPIGWQAAPPFQPGGPSGVGRSKDHYSGNYSVMMLAQDSNYGPQLTSGQYDVYGNLTGGLPYQLTTDTLTGYYKYITSHSDTGGVLVNLQNQGTNVLQTGVSLLQASTWTPFAIPISATITPDTMRIDLYSSTTFSGIGGSILYIDDLQLKSQTSGISFNSKPDFGISAFPDPAQNQLNIRFAGNVPSEFSLKIYNSEGRLMIDNEFNSGGSTYTVPIEQLCAGLYFYEITANGLTVRNKFVRGN